MVDRSRVTWPEFLTWEGWEEVDNKLLVSPDDYDNQKFLSFSIPASSEAVKRKKEIKEWCHILSSNQDIQSISIYGATTQELFNAVCNQSSLIDLRICNASGNLVDLAPLANLVNLRRLFFDSATKIIALDIIGELNKLEWLELIDFKRVGSLKGMEKLSNLKGLVFVSRGRSSLIKLDSYSYLSSLRQLLYLDVSGTRIADKNLSPIAKLSKLKYLDIPLIFEIVEIVKITNALPECDHDLGPFRFLPNEKCHKCNKNQMVLPISKGARAMCKICKESRVQELIREFNLSASTIS